MPNWCYTSYVFEGEEREIDALYNTMTQLENAKQQHHPNDFGNCWLGNLVIELDGDWEKTECRGEWLMLNRSNPNTLCFDTETAWRPMNETMDLILCKFPGLRYYYFAESDDEYLDTNDTEGKYFTERLKVEICFKGINYFEYVPNLDEAFSYIQSICGGEIKTIEDVKALNRDSYCENEDDYIVIVEAHMSD